MAISPVLGLLLILVVWLPGNIVNAKPSGDLSAGSSVLNDNAHSVERRRYIPEVIGKRRDEGHAQSDLLQNGSGETKFQDYFSKRFREYVGKRAPSYNDGMGHMKVKRGPLFYVIRNYDVKGSANNPMGLLRHALFNDESHPVVPAESRRSEEEDFLRDARRAGDRRIPQFVGKRDAEVSNANSANTLTSKQRTKRAIWPYPEWVGKRSGEAYRPNDHAVNSFANRMPVLENYEHKRQPIPEFVGKRDYLDYLLSKQTHSYNYDYLRKRRSAPDMILRM